MEKPAILYHGSVHKNIEEFKPIKKSYRDPNEGPVVFATSNKALATCFITHLKNLQCGILNGIVYIAMNKKEFLESDTGGSLYELSSESFESDPSKGMGKNEWVSKVSVKLLRKELYKSSLDAMLENTVQVYLTDAHTLATIKNAPDHGISILRSLQSENQKRNINIRQL